MISCVMNVIKEKKTDVLATPWVNAWVAYLLAVWWATATVGDDEVVAWWVRPYWLWWSGYHQGYGDCWCLLVSCIICVKMGTAHTAMGLNVMTQALHAKDGSLPQDLTIQNTYTELHSGSKNVTVVLRNSMVYPQTLRKKTPVARAVAATWVPGPPMQTGVTEALDRGPRLPKCQSWLWSKGRRNCSRNLDLSGLETWPPEPVQIPPSLSLLSTIMSSPWSPVQMLLYSFNQTCDQSYW